MAVFTPVSLDEAQLFASGYGLGEVTAFTPIEHGVENTNYRLTADGRTFALTLFERRMRVEDLPFVLGLTAHLADHDYPAPRPLARADGIIVGRLNDRPAALISWLSGDWLRSPTLAELSAAGACLGVLHTACDDYQPEQPNRFGPAAWRELAAACEEKVRAPYEALTEALSAAITTLADRWPGDQIGRASCRERV